MYLLIVVTKKEIDSSHFLLNFIIRFIVPKLQAVFFLNLSKWKSDRFLLREARHGNICRLLFYKDEKDGFMVLFNYENENDCWNYASNSIKMEDLRVHFYYEPKKRCL